MKKIISLALVLALVLSAVSGAFSAVAASYDTEVKASADSTVWVFEPVSGKTVETAQPGELQAYTIKSKESGKYLTIAKSGSDADGVSVTFCGSDRNEKDNKQLWAFFEVSDGVYNLVNAACQINGTAGMIWYNGNHSFAEYELAKSTWSDGGNAIVFNGNGTIDGKQISELEDATGCFEATMNFRYDNIAYICENYEPISEDETAVTLDGRKSTVWVFEPAGSDVPTHSVYAALYTVRSKLSGKYLTAVDNGDDTVSLCGKDRDENDYGQLWGFDALWGNGPLAIINAGCADPCAATNPNRADYCAMLYLDLEDGQLKKDCQHQSGDGERTVLLKGTDAGISDVTGGSASDGNNHPDSSKLRSFEATINFQSPALYLHEEYSGPVYEEPQTEPTVKMKDVVIGNDNSFSTEWKFTPVRVFDCYNADGSFAQSAGKDAKGIYAYTIQSTKTGGYLTAVYNSDNTAITLQTGTRNTEDDRQLWAFTKVWSDMTRYGMLNLGYMRDCTDGSGNQYPAYIKQDNAVTSPHGGGEPSNGDVVYFGHVSNWVGDKTIEGLISEQVSSDESFVTTFAIRDAYYMEKSIVDSTANAPAPTKLNSVCYGNGVTAEKGSFEFIPIALEDIYYNSGELFGSEIIYVIKSKDTGAFLTANYNDDNDNITLTLEARNTENDCQRWVITQAWPSNPNFTHYFVINMGKMQDCTDESGNKYPVVLKGDFSAEAFKTVDNGDGLYNWDLSTSSSSENSISALKAQNADGSFSVALLNRASSRIIYEDNFDTSAAQELQVLNVLDIEASTLYMNNDLKWKFTAVGDYFTIQNQRTGLYLTMNNNQVYTANRDQDNNYQLWKLVDRSDVYGVAGGIYEIQCYNTGKAINTIGCEFSFEDVSSRGAIGGRCWTLKYNRGLLGIEDEFTAPINSYQFDGTDSKIQFYLAGENSVWGDLNDDGVCNLLDLVKLKKAMASQEQLSTVYDIDGEEGIGDSNDLIALRKYIVSK